MVSIVGELWCEVVSMVGELWCEVVSMVGELWCEVVSMVGELWCEVTSSRTWSLAGKEDVDEPDKVSDLQWTMAQCLRWLLRSGRPDPDLHFASIIGVFLSMKTYACSYYEWMNNRPFAHYSQFEKNELLAEWFSAS